MQLSGWQMGGSKMLTGKQRSKLKGIANGLSPVVSIGKSGLTPTVIKSIDDYLTANEILKCNILEGAKLDAKETCNAVAQELGAEFVQAIGRRFVLYRQAMDPEKRKIEL